MTKKITLYLLILLFMLGCRGWRSEKPPVHPNINFDFQPKVKAQSDPLPIPENTTQYNVDNIPSSLRNYVINEEFIRNGQKNYNIYCASCHTRTGNGTKSVISQNGWVVSNILDKVTRDKKDREIFNIIKYGIRSMPAYEKKINNEEIWQIVLYVKALQKIESASKNEINRLRNDK